MNFASLIDAHDAEVAALVGPGGDIGYGSLRERSSRLRGGLAAHGIGQGDRVAIVAVNSPLFVEALLAVLGTGATAVPLNPLSPPAELQREMSHAAASAVVAGPTGARSVGRLDAKFLESVLVFAPSAAELTGASSLEELFEHEPAAVADVPGDHEAVVLFTSGTAGASRGAALTHHNLLVNHEQVLAADPEAVLPGDRVLAVLPFFHVYGLNVVLGLALRVGAAVVIEERFDPDRTLETVSRHSVSVLAAGPPVWNAWAQLDAPQPALAGLRIARSGAAALPIATAERLEREHGVLVAEGYGLTEASPVVTLPLRDQVRHGSVGHPVPGVEVRLVDEEGRDSLVGDPGELWVRGPNVFSGYLGDDAPQVVDADGWLHTGDVAVLDDDGWLFLVDRLKDLIIVSGFNVYPNEVEAVLVEHPAVAQAVVVGVPDASTGEAIVGHVAALAGHTVEEADVLEFAAERLPRFKCPRRIDVHDVLPTGLAGKTPRRLLRPQ